MHFHQTRVTDPQTGPLWARTRYRARYPSQTHPLPLLLTAPPTGEILAAPHAKVLRPSHLWLSCCISLLPEPGRGMACCFLASLLLRVTAIAVAAPLSHPDAPSKPLDATLSATRFAATAGTAVWQAVD
jgi:hypothetical protein